MDTVVQKGSGRKRMFNFGRTYWYDGGQSRVKVDLWTIIRINYRWDEINDCRVPRVVSRGRNIGQNPKSNLSPPFIPEALHQAFRNRLCTSRENFVPSKSSTV